MTANWEDHARCKTVGPDAMFPDQGQTDDYRAAKAVCQWCPVRAQCLAYALEMEGNRPAIQRAGVWGGTTPRERAAISRQQHAA